MAPRTTRTLVSPDGGEFQKVWVHVSHNDSGSIFRRVLVVYENESLRHDATIPRRRCGSRGTPTAPSDVRKNNVVRSLSALETFVSSSRKRGYPRSAALRPTWALRWHIFSKPTSRSKLK
jgi:hypothetical protein